MILIPFSSSLPNISIGIIKIQKLGAACLKGNRDHNVATTNPLELRPTSPENFFAGYNLKASVQQDQRIQQYPYPLLFTCEVMGINNIPKIAATVSFLLFANLCYMQTFSAISTILATNDTIKDGDTLVSEGEDFALGFFSPHNSTNRYVGIWYNKIRPETIVWVANRDTPLADSSGIIKIDVNGDLVILDGRGGAIWSTNISTLAKVAHAELLDTGNLQLRELDSDNNRRRVLWESFNYTSDTILPSMKLYADPKRNDTRLGLTSWRSTSDPSPGNFSLGIDPQTLPQVVIWDGADLRWRSGPWDGRTYLGVPDMDYTYLSGYNLIRNSDGVLEFSYDYFNGSFYTRPGTECDLYGRCGPNGRCSMSSSPICNCLKGFEPKYDGEWNSGNWSGGCVRSKQLKCEKNGNGSWKRDGFLKMEKIKVPDVPVSLAAGSLTECEDKCQKNCSCVAYAYDSMIGCMIWGGDLMDIQQFAKGGVDFNIRLPASELGQWKRETYVAFYLVAYKGVLHFFTSCSLVLLISSQVSQVDIKCEVEVGDGC
ncbi:hypothetical protein MRB53_022354 [Persea americana]|uniref:Uncharacterized protein n=1 Tax=Persea americana TaxID=3435 RepID=A0ACC2L777_PERAE|nr:hypothetical protein MRB53_022354 [Persea americana]